MKFKAVIFDLDGTLLDTIEDIKITMNLALKRYNYSEFSVEEYKYFVGKGVDNLIREVMKTASIPVSAFKDLKVAYYEIYKEQATVNTKLYDGISDLLAELKKNNVSLNVLSNKPHHQTVEVIKHFFGEDVFDLVYGKKEDFSPKPDPASALDLTNALGIKPEDVLYVGDTETDILTAKNAGFYSVGVLWGFRKADELIRAGACKIVKHPLEILNLM